MSKLNRFFLALLLILVGSQSARAGVLRPTEADSLVSSDHTKAWSLPTSSTSIVGGVEFQEIPSGTVNSSNVTFTLSSTPVSNASVKLFLDGRMQTQGSGKDYTISGTTITMATAPETAQELYVIYAKY